MLQQDLLKCRSLVTILSEKVKYKNDKGVAGLSILLSVIVLLFLIGLVVMIFSLMGGGLRDATYTPTTISVTNESVTFSVTNVAQTLGASTKRDAVCNAITYIANQTTTGVSLALGNITKTGCSVINASVMSSAGTGNNRTVYVSYTYSWNADNTATNVINDTTTSLTNVSDWFDIFVVITAMVVLILLVVIIITAIRGSGLVAEGGTSGANKVGTA